MTADAQCDHEILNAQVMLFCQYPFERASDDQDQGHFQKVLTRIINVDYHIPTNVPISKECRDILSNILVADPRRRLSILDIQWHPWYVIALAAAEPLRAAAHNETLAAGSPRTCRPG